MQRESRDGQHEGGLNSSGIGDVSPSASPTRRLLLILTSLGLLAAALVLGFVGSTVRAVQEGPAVISSLGVGDALPPRKLLLDPCWIRQPCYKGAYWHAGTDQMGTGWYCNDGQRVDQWAKIDVCHIQGPCYFGILYSKKNKRWECGMENRTQLSGKYTDLMHKVRHGPAEGDRIWAMQELKKDLPAASKKCWQRGWTAPRECRMLNMDHGKLMLQVKGSSVILDLLLEKDGTLRGLATDMIYSLVLDDKDNLRWMLDKMGGLPSLVSAFNPDKEQEGNEQGKAVFFFNMLAEKCQGGAPDMCTFFSDLAKMDASGLAKLVWDPPKAVSSRLQASLQEAWVSSCTIKRGYLTTEDFKACGGDWLSKVPDGSYDKAYALMQSMTELLRTDDTKVMFKTELYDGIHPWVDNEKVPGDLRWLGKRLLSQS